MTISYIFKNFPSHGRKITKKSAVERFEEEVNEFVKNLLKTEYDQLFKNKQSREDYAKQIGRFHLIHYG